MRFGRAIINETQNGPLILVLEASEETRDGIKELLNENGYRVDSARNEREAVVKGNRQNPDLILVSLGESSVVDILAMASRIRQGAELSQNVPVVIFCVQDIPEGLEVEIGINIYATRPDNFRQLKDFLGRLIDQRSAPL